MSVTNVCENHVNVIHALVLTRLLGGGVSRASMRAISSVVKYVMQTAACLNASNCQSGCSHTAESVPSGRRRTRLPVPGA